MVNDNHSPLAWTRFLHLINATRISSDFVMLLTTNTSLTLRTIWINSLRFHCFPIMPEILMNLTCSELSMCMPKHECIWQTTVFDSLNIVHSPISLTNHRFGHSTESYQWIWIKIYANYPNNRMFASNRKIWWMWKVAKYRKIRIEIFIVLINETQSKVWSKTCFGGKKSKNNTNPIRSNVKWKICKIVWNSTVL